MYSQKETGLVEPNRNEEQNKRILPNPIYIPIDELKLREYIAVLLGLGLLLVLGNITLPLGTPLSDRPLEHIQAPWIFGGIQWLLIRWPIVIAGWAIPSLSVLFLLLLPWWSRLTGSKITRLLFITFTFLWVFLILAYQVGG